MTFNKLATPNSFKYVKTSMTLFLITSKFKITSGFKFCFNNRGFRFNVPNDNEKEYLTQQASILEGQLQKIKNRINEL